MFTSLDLLTPMEKADLECLDLLYPSNDEQENREQENFSDPDPQIVKIVCLNGLEYCLDKLQKHGYAFTKNDVECLLQCAETTQNGHVISLLKTLSTDGLE